MWLIPPFKYDIILFPAHEVIVMWIHTDLGRRNLGGGRAVYREYVISRRIRSSGRVFSSWLVNSASLIWDTNRWSSGRVSASATVAVGSISSVGDYGVHCWWESIRSKQLYSVPYVSCRCLPDFIIIIILIYIYILRSTIYRRRNRHSVMSSRKICII